MRVATAPLLRARRFGWVAAFLAAGTLAGLATDAAAQSTISGRVTSSTTSNGLVNAVVQFYDLNGNGEAATAEATTDAMGFYTSPTLPAGDYGVLTQNIDGYINKAWDNVSCSAVCDVNSITPVTVVNTPVTNINFVLDPGGRIQGTITSSATGLPIAGVRVYFADQGQNLGFTYGVSDATGHYISQGGTAAGNVYACTSSNLPYQDEAYNDVKSPGCDLAAATLIPVTLAGVTGIDFALDPGGQITGTVTDINGAPLAGVQIEVRDANGNGTANGTTDALGHYATSGVAAGTHYVSTRNDLGLADKLYNGLYCAGGNCNSALGTPLSLMVGTVITGIDFVLPPGGRITGTVTNALGGAPLQSIFIQLSDAASNFMGGAQTDASGVYTIGPVPAGVYYASTGFAPGFLIQNYNNLPCTLTICPATAGTPITVAVNATTGGIDFTLTPQASGGGISGTVISTASGLPVATYPVVLNLPNGAQVASVNTDASGNYAFTGLAPGPYYVRTNGGTGLINQIYNGIVCVQCNVGTSGANPVNVSAGATTGGINFSLATGGRITGTITNAVGGGALQGQSTQVFNTASVQMGGGTANASGVYTTQGLPPGTYYIRTAGSAAINELYNNIPCPMSGCNVLTGAPVTVTANTLTSGINFALDAGGRISGNVTNATSTLPMQGVSVQIFNAYGSFLGNAPGTDASGNYTSPVLPAGTYYVRTANNFGFADELYNNVVCLNTVGCSVTSGTPVTVTNGAITSNINFGLVSGTGIAGRVTDANTTLGLSGVAVQIYDSNGVFARSAPTNATGNYVLAGLPPGTYYARTSAVGTTFYLDKLFNGSPCSPTCTVTTGTPIVIVAGAATTVTGIDFALAPGGGAISGTVTDAVTGIPIPGVSIQIYDGAGALAKSGGSSATGTFAISGLPAGTYYARTAVASGINYADELYSNKQWPCTPSCAVTTGTPITVTNSATQGGIDFSLAPNLAQNGQFLNGLGSWLLFSTPDSSYMVSNVTNGVFQFARVAPPPGTSNQALVFQNTGLAVAANAPLVTQFDLGNTDTVRKRISVLVQDSDFTDLSVCTFWLPPSAPLRTYAIRTHTTKAWVNATIGFYAATAGTNGFYQLDNVIVHAEPAVSATETMCVDPTAPVPPGGVDSSTLLVNGDFSSGTVAPGWSLFGQISGAVTSGVFQFIKLAGTPSGVILQPTAQTTTANEILTASFQLGNSSGVRKRVTVILHDNNFSDLSACTFWLPPGQALSNYTYRTFATQAWANATLSVYPATTGPDQWIRLDNVSLKRTPTTAIVGTECLEPGSSPDQASPETWSRLTPAGAVDVPVEVEVDGFVASGFQVADQLAPSGDARVWIAAADGPATAMLRAAEAIDLTTAAAARLRFQSWLMSVSSRASVQVSVDGVTWTTIHVVSPSDGWADVDVDLGGQLGEIVYVRLVLQTFGAPDGAMSDVWRVGDVAWDVVH